MDDDKLLKEIKDSAEQVEIPQSLKPEEVRRRLERRRKKIISFNKYGRWAAAAAVLVIALLVAVPVLERQNASETNSGQAVTQDSAQQASTTVKGKEESVADSVHDSSADSAENSVAVSEQDSVSDSARAASTTESTEDSTEDSTAESTENSQAMDNTKEGSDAGGGGTSVAGSEEEDSSNEENGVLHVKDYSELYTMVGVSPRQIVTVPEEANESFGAAEMDGGVVYSTEPYNPTASNQTAAENAVAADKSHTAIADTAMAAAGSFASAADTASKEYSSTNIQEENVDEADIVKTDGKYIYILDAEGAVRIIEAETMDLAGKISFDGDSDSEVEDMYVDGDILQIIRSGFDYVMSREDLYLLEDEAEAGETDTSAAGADGMQSYGTDDADGEMDMRGFRPNRGVKPPTRSYYSVPKYFTEVVTYDISDCTAPEKTGTYRQDGSYLTSRKNGEYLYVFTSFTPESGHGVAAKGYYVPKAGDIYLPCESIYLPGAERGGYYCGRSYLVAASLKNSETSKTVDRMAVVNGAGTFYVSQENIYTAVTGYDDDGDYTELLRLGYRDGIFTAGRTGRIPGTVNNNFSLDEYKGKLRAVTTRDEEVKQFFTGETELVRSNGLYVLDSALKVIGKIENLAKGESIESARFMGDTGYFVTYRNTDPLFSVDLSDPEHPEVLGELKITGFSEYLHFYGENKLLGLGWETDPVSGGRIGFKCSMFDLTDPGDVRETDRLVLDDVSFCDALDNYKAILVDQEKNIFGFTYAVTNEENWEDVYYYGVFSYSEDAGFRTLRYIKLPESIADKDSDAVRVRGLYIGDTFYLAGCRGIIAYDMKDDFRKMESFVWRD